MLLPIIELFHFNKINHVNGAQVVTRVLEQVPYEMANPT
jgi:hypothetical protein